MRNAESAERAHGPGLACFPKGNYGFGQKFRKVSALVADPGRPAFSRNPPSNIGDVTFGGRPSSSRKRD